MTKYICPQCNSQMLYNGTYEVYFCNNEETQCKMEYNLCLDVGDKYNYQFLVNDKVIATGTFEECCRIFKLKAFL